MTRNSWVYHKIKFDYNYRLVNIATVRGPYASLRPSWSVTVLSQFGKRAPLKSKKKGNDQELIQ